MAREGDLVRADGRTVHWYEDGPEEAGLVLFWHHGTPNIGQPPGPLMRPATERGIRWVSLDRPGYGGSTRREGRCVADVADDVAAVADELGVARFAVAGHSGGGPHALACAALLDDRVLACVAIAGLAPFDADGLDWFGGMADGGRREFEAAATSDAALEHGPDGMMDDDRAYVTPWGFDAREAGGVPVLLVHGGQDRVAPLSHAQWLAGAVPGADLRVFPEDGHISVLLQAEALLDWLVEAAPKVI